MENKNSNYRIADVSEEDIKYITELEHTLCSKKNKDIILVAYESKSSLSSERV